MPTKPTLIATALAAAARSRDLEAALREAERALRPFEAEASTWSETIDRRFKPGVCEPRTKFSHSKAEFSIGDLRRAHAVSEHLRTLLGDAGN